MVGKYFVSVLQNWHGTWKRWKWRHYPYRAKMSENTHTDLVTSQRKRIGQYLKNKKGVNASDSRCPIDQISIPIPHIFATFTKSLHVLHLRPPYIADLVMMTADESSKLDWLFGESFLKEKMVLI